MPAEDSSVVALSAVSGKGCVRTGDDVNFCFSVSFLYPSKVLSLLQEMVWGLAVVHISECIFDTNLWRPENDFNSRTDFGEVRFVIACVLLGIG